MLLRALEHALGLRATFCNGLSGGGALSVGAKGSEPGA